jgi:hypothetical protein
MPRTKKLRRFDSRYVVSASAVEEEARFIDPEMENYVTISRAAIDAKRTERYNLCTQTWEHLKLLFPEVPEQQQRILHCLLFRDLYYVLELYRTYLRQKRPEVANVPRATVARESVDEAFSEFLFEL